MSLDPSDKQMVVQMIERHYELSILLAAQILDRLESKGVRIGERDHLLVELSGMMNRDIGQIVAMFMGASPDSIQRSIQIQNDLLDVIEKKVK